MKHWFVPIAATLLAALTFTVGIAVTIVGDSRSDRTFGLGEKTAIIQVLPDLSQDQTLTVSDVEHWLSAYNLGLVIDGLGDGLPGLEVVDPAHLVSWLPRGAVRGIEHKHPGGSTVVFQGTYCDKQWQTTRRCALVPQGSNIVGDALAPPGVKSQQYAYIPPPDYALHPGSYILTGGDSDALQSFKTMVESGGFSTAKPVRPGYLRDLVMNPFFEISLALAALAAVLVAISLVGRFRRDQAEMVVRMQSGAHRSKLVNETVLKALPYVVLGSILGAGTMPLATSLIAGVPWSPRETSIVSLTAAAVSALTMCALVALASCIAIATQTSRRSS